MKKVIELANKLNDCFEYKTFDRGTDKERTISVIKDEEEIGQELHYLCIELVYRDNIADNYTYNYIWAALDIIASQKEDSTEDNIHEALQNDLERHQDIYTYSLTTWLNSNINRVEYMSEALREFLPSSGFDILYISQGIEINEMFVRTFDFLRSKTQEN